MFKSTKVDATVAAGAVVGVLGGVRRAGLGHLRRGCVP